jgi:hypothetical protein
MYFGVQHTTDALGLERVMRVCRKCGKQALVDAAGSGEGSAHSPFGLDDSAGERAAKQAYSAASYDAWMSAHLLACNACGTRDATARRAAMMKASSPAFLVGALVFFLGSFVGCAVSQNIFSIHTQTELVTVVTLAIGLAAAGIAGGLVIRTKYKNLVQRAEGAASYVQGQS